MRKPLLLLLLLLATGLTAQVNLEITEIFSGQAGDDLTADWFEIANTGSTAWIAGVDPDLYYDDESAAPGDADLIMGLTDLQPGERAIVLITGDPVEVTTFIGVWSPVYDLTGIEVGTADGAGLGGGGDVVNIWIGDPTLSAPAATAGYPDTAPFDGQSYDVSLMAFSTVGNANDAVATLALGGGNMDVPNIGSPGDQGAVQADPNAPVILGGTLLAAPFLDLPLEGPGYIGLDTLDPNDPTLLGIPFILDDADHDVSLLTLTATSSNATVLPAANVTFNGNGAQRNLFLEPAGTGYVTLTVTVTDPDGKTDSYSLQLAISAAAPAPGSTRYHHGASDGSTAIAQDGQRMWIADDENQTIRLYHRDRSGLPIKMIDFDADLGSDNEVDIEGSFQAGDQIYWTGSHTNAERSVIFRTQRSGMGDDATLTFTGSYTTLRDELLAWDASNGHGLGANYLNFTSGFEIEGFSRDPANPNGAWLAFRGPLIQNRALLVPVTNLLDIVSPNPVPGSATFGTPVELDLQGHSLRSIACNSEGCLLVGGPFATTNDFKLYTWTGNPNDAPELRAADLTDYVSSSALEGIVDLPAGDFLGANGDNAEVPLLFDTGTFDYYGDGSEAKDLPHAQWKKCRTERIVLGAVTEPPVANPGDIVINEIMQNPAAVNDDAGEWFELYNRTAVPIDLNGWMIIDKDTDTLMIDNGGPLFVDGGGYLVFGVNNDLMSNGGVMLDYTYDINDLALGNGADELIVVASDGLEIDRVEWDGGPTFPDPTGASMSLFTPTFDNNDGTNWCEAATPYGDGDFGTPGAANDCPPPPMADLQVTEIWCGQDGDDLTADWFEITNFGPVAWIAGTDPDLYYDDDSQDPASADPINGLVDIQPGESVIVLVDQESAIATFSNIWNPDYDMSGIEIGWTDGSGLGQGGDAVTLFLGPPAVDAVIDYATYPAAPSGVSYDLVLDAFSEEGAGLVQTGTNIAVATTATAGSTGLEPAIGSPGNQGPTGVLKADLQISEIFAGQAGDDLTADWFEIRNTGNAPWTSGVDADLYYDDESQDPVDATLITGITAIAPGGSAIVLITDNLDDVTAFNDVWSPVIDLTGVGIGTTDGAGLGGGGDLVTLWLGDPTLNQPVDTASYPDTGPFDGQSWDVELQAYSVVGNANGAVQTVALGGNNMDVPNIGSPGNGLAIAPNLGLVITEIFAGQAGDDLTSRLVRDPQHRQPNLGEWGGSCSLL